MSSANPIQRIALPLVLLAACAHGDSPPPPLPATVTAEVSGHGADIVLVPGLSGSALPWRATANRLSGSRRVHLTHIAGLGPPDNSPGDTVRSTSMLADELALYLRRHTRTPATLVGHSAGGVAALTLALHYPELVDRVVIVDALPFMSANRGSTNVDDALVAAAAAERDVLLSESDLEFMARMVDQAAGSMQDAETAARIAADGAQANRSAYAAIASDLMTVDLRPLVSALTVPVAVIYADQAPRGAPPGHMAQRYSAQYAGSNALLLEVRDSGHYVMLDQPAQFALALDTAIGDVDGND